MPEEPKAPRRKFDLTIHIGGDTWRDVKQELERLIDHIDERGDKCGCVTGGCSVGSAITCIVDESMTPQKYREAVEDFCKRKFPKG